MNSGEEAILLRAVLESATDGIITIDERGVIESYNKAAADLFGYSAAEVLGKNVSMLMTAHDRVAHDGYIERYLQTGEPRIIGVGREVMGRRKDGSEFPMRLAVSEVQLRERRIFTGIIYDLVLQKEMQRRWKALNDALETKVEERTEELEATVSKLLETNQKLKKEIKERIEVESMLREKETELVEALENEKKMGELKSRFVTMASHEFRTPLSTILSSTELIEFYVREDQQGKRMRNVRRIKSAVGSLTNILNDFLSLSKLEEGDVRAQPAELELGAFCAELMDELNLILKPGQELVHHQENTDIPLKMDKQFLKNIIGNLVSNASKYSDPGAVIQCHVLVKQGEEMVIRIKDQGMGIPQEDQPFLFERFFRAHNVENIQGTGLGLNIVKEYVDLLGGAISFESKLGEGSLFEVKLPLQ